MIKQVDKADAQELSVYSLSRESELKHFYEPAPGLFVAESPNVVLRALKAGYIAKSILMEERLLHAKGSDRKTENDIWLSIQGILNKAFDIPIFVTDIETISSICGFRQSRGFLAVFERRKNPSWEEIIQNSRRIVILENIQNPTNIGAIFRSASALGMDAVLLSEGCADPLYRRSSRVSMGGVFCLPWAFLDGKSGKLSVETLQKLKIFGFSLAAMALDEDPVTLSDARLNKEERLAVLFGNEENGLSKEALSICDYRVQIPMQNSMDSLNVAASSAIAFYQLGKSR